MALTKFMFDLQTLNGIKIKHNLKKKTADKHIDSL